MTTNLWPGRSGPSGGREVTFGDLFSVVVRYRYHILAVGVAGMLVTAIDLLRAPDTWSSSATILPQRQSTLSGAAAQLGWTAPQNDVVQSPIFYTEMIHFRAVLREVVDSARIPSSGGRVVSLYEALQIRDSNARIRQESAMDAVSGMVSASPDDKTGIVEISVRARSPQLALGVAEAVLRALVRFNGEVRQSGAAAEREFIEGRRAEIRSELFAAEEALKSFLRQNRGGQSPDLAFDQRRLEAEVNLRRELYLSLSQAYERARIEAVRDTPVLSVIDEPQLAMSPDPKPGAKGLFVGLFGGLVAGVVLAFLLESFKLARAAARRTRTVA